MVRRILSRVVHGVMAGLIAVLSCGLMGAGLGGCSRIMGPKPGGDPIPDYADGPAGLEALFSDILAAAKADDRARVHDLFQSLKLTRPELEQLFGTTRAGELAQPYEEMMATLIHRGAVEIVGVVYEKKYDTVEVIPVTLDLDPGDGGSISTSDGGVGGVRAEDVPLARALVHAPQLYAVRFKKAGAALGTRYDFMFFSGGKWRTGNQLGKLLAKRAQELHPAPPASAARPETRTEGPAARTPPSPAKRAP